MINTLEYLHNKAKEGYTHYPSAYRGYNYQEVCSLMEDYMKIALTEYTQYLLKNGYADTDILGEGEGEASAIDQFLMLNKKNENNDYGVKT